MPSSSTWRSHLLEFCDDEALSEEKGLTCHWKFWTPLLLRSRVSFAELHVLVSLSLFLGCYLTIVSQNGCLRRVGTRLGITGVDQYFWFEFLLLLVQFSRMKHSVTFNGKHYLPRTITNDLYLSISQPENLEGTLSFHQIRPRQNMASATVGHNNISTM